MAIPEINISDYTYDLPEDRIASYPVAERDASKLLIYNKGVISDIKVSYLILSSLTCRRLSLRAV